MTPFTFSRPASLGEAVAGLAGAERSKVICGGQNLLLAMKERQSRPASLVSVAGLPELHGIAEAADGSLRIGAATTYRELAAQNFGGWRGELNRVAGNLADRAVRAMGTIGGGVVQADPRYDMPVALSAMGAAFLLTSPRGERVLAAAAFFNPAGGTTIAADEILVAISLPPLPHWTAVAFEKFSFRTFEAAVLTVGGAARRDADGVIASLSIVVGAVAPAPRVATTTAWEGQPLAGLDPAEVAATIARDVLPPATTTTRRRQYQAELIVTLCQRVLRRLGAA